MRLFLTLFLFASSAVAQSLPDPHLTPGVARPLSRDQICKTKWGKDHRFVTQKMKVQICLAYGISANCPGPNWELDHLIPRELAGADVIGNIWPQPIKEARQKDKIENRLHKVYCARVITLLQAQSRVKQWRREK